MGYKCTFMDNEVYSASDVNAIFASIVTDGVALADSGNMMSDLNNAVSQVTSEGVQQFEDSCKLTKTNGTYKIGEGVCFMPDGSAITFDSNGYEITPIAGAKTYVYIKRNATKNTIDVITSTSAGESGTVPIGEISSGGEVTDTRKYAKAKIRLNQPNTIEAFSFTMKGQETKDINVGRSDFTRIIMHNVIKEQSNGTALEYFAVEKNVQSIADGEKLLFNMKRYGNYSSEFYICITKNGDTVQFSSGDTYTSYTYTVNFEIIA